MRRVLLAVVSLLVLQAVPAAAEPTTPPVQTGQNLPPLVATGLYDAGDGFGPQITAYHDSGQYLADQKSIAWQAIGYLDNYVAQCKATADCKPAIVFDIDDTLLSWYSFYAKRGFSPTGPQWSAGVKNCQTPVITPVVALYNHAKALGVTPFLITGRNDTDRSDTAKCLKKRGITGYGALIMRSADQEDLTAAVYKLREREKLAGQGWDLALAIGDQVSDSAGEVPTGKFVLPNPMYFIP